MCESWHVCGDANLQQHLERKKQFFILVFWFFLRGVFWIGFHFLGVVFTCLFCLVVCFVMVVTWKGLAAQMCVQQWHMQFQALLGTKVRGPIVRGLVCTLLLLAPLQHLLGSAPVRLSVLCPLYLLVSPFPLCGSWCLYLYPTDDIGTCRGFYLKRRRYPTMGLCHDEDNMSTGVRFSMVVRYSCPVSATVRGVRYMKRPRGGGGETF